MRLITEGDDLCVRFWTHQSLENTFYRLIHYHVFEETGEDSLLLNTVTGEIVVLDQKEVKLLSSLPAVYSPDMDDLIKHRFLVPVDFDEFNSVNQLRAVIRKVRTTSYISGFTILPTSGCNARCFYCYESSVPHYNMSLETADQVVDYIERHCGPEKKVSLHWFGGEPTLMDGRIDRICEGLRGKGVAYTSSMISNGYLFSESLVDKAKDIWKLKKVQITLDGTEEVYNRTKSYVYKDDNPFARVLDNIRHLLNRKIRVSVRMNLGLHNTEDLKSLVSILGERFSSNEYFDAYVHELFENQGFVPQSFTLQDRNDLEAAKELLNKEIIKNGCNYSESPGRKKQQVPSLKLFYCMADNPNSLLINPLGEFGKCEHVFYGQNLGNISKEHDFSTSDAKYWLNTQYVDTCHGCKLFPYCGQIEVCETKSVCYSDQIRNKKINDVKGIMREQFKGGKYSG